MCKKPPFEIKKGQIYDDIYVVESAPYFLYFLDLVLLLSR
jgi:hypothetical protein